LPLNISPWQNKSGSEAKRWQRGEEEEEEERGREVPEEERERDGVTAGSYMG